MTRYYLTSLTVEGFRGINNEGTPLVLKFRPDAVNSVFAQNGTGKSSLYEALHYAIRKSVPTLAPMQVGESPDRYVNNLFHSAGTATVSLELTPDDGSGLPIEVTVTRDAAGNRAVTATPDVSDPEELLASLDQDFTLLDHRTFHEFIETSALERGRSFAPLLGLSKYSQLRRGLQSAADTRAYNSDFDVQVIDQQIGQTQRVETDALAAFTATYAYLTGLAVTDSAALSTYAGEVVAALESIPLLTSFAHGKRLSELDFAALKAHVLDAEGGALRAELEAQTKLQASLLAIAPNSEEVESHITALEGWCEAYDTQLKLTRGRLTKQLNETAKALIDTGAWSDPLVCPLCGSTLESSIADRIQATLANYDAVRAAYIVLTEQVSAGPLLASLRRLETAPLALDGEENLSASLQSRSDLGTLGPEDVANAADRWRLLEKRRATALAAASSELERLARAIPPSLVEVTTRITSAEQALGNLTSIWHSRTNREGLSARLRLYSEWKTFMDNVAAMAAQAEADLSRQVLTSLESDYQQMFAAIMSVKDIVPSLDRGGSGEHLALHLSEFHGIQDVSARALLSESFKNALAISVFLTAAVRHGRAARFVVLDDATSSFDSGNQYQLMEHIRGSLQAPHRADGLQFILLSHDVALEKYFDKNQTERDWNHQKLHGWPPISPVTAARQDADRLRTQAEGFISTGQTDVAGGLIRQYLEFILLQIITKLGIPVPIDIAIKDHARMVDACLRAIVECVDLHRRAGDLILDPAQVTALSVRHVPALVGNWISHYGTAGAASFSPPALLGVLDDIDQIRSCFQHEVPPGSGSWRYYKSLTARG